MMTTIKDSSLRRPEQIITILAAAGVVLIFTYREYRRIKDSKTAGDDNDESTPVFQYDNQDLTETVLDMAIQRAKRWMSFRVSNADHMVGQVGGRSSDKRPVLIIEPNFLLKPVNLDHRGIREVAFYEAIRASVTKKHSGFDTYCRLFGPRDMIPLSPKDVFSSWVQGRRAESSSRLQQCCDKARVKAETKLLHRLELFTCEYYGMVEYVPDVSSAEAEVGPYGTNYNSHLLLHNLTTHFSKPCVLDLKMGTDTFEPDAPIEKKLREKAKYPAQTEFGFRLVAMRIYNPADVTADKGGYVYYPKSFGRSLERRDAVKRGLRSFFGGSDLPKNVQVYRSGAIKKILHKLKLIRSWFRDNYIFSFTASSILLIYEGNTVTNEVDGVQPDMATAKMIDFGRVRRQRGGDQGYLKGLNNLIEIVEEILKESFWTEEYNYLK